MAIRFDSRSAAGLLWLGPPVLAGAVLRAWGISTQVMGGDAVHAVRAALEKPAGLLLRTYDAADYCLPLAALYRFSMDRGEVLSELSLRLPVLVAGLIALVWIPLSLRRRISAPAVVALAWLVAISPMLVLYSRIARSYMPMALLAFAAAICFERWWRNRATPFAVAYAVLAAAAVYLHLAAGPFVLAPFLFAAGALLADRSADPRDALRLAALLLGTALAMALFAVPAWESLSAVVASKRSGAFPGAMGLLDVMELHAGTPVLAVALLFFVGAARGLAVLARRDGALAAYTATLVVGQLAGLAILTPTLLEDPLVFARYSIVCLPVWLLWLAVGLTEPIGPDPRGAFRRFRPVLVALVLLALAATGPLASRAFFAGSLTTHRSFLAYSSPGRPLAPDEAPSFYAELAGRAPGAIIEFPWNMSWQYSQSLFAYSRIHGRRVLFSTPFTPLYDPRLRLRSIVAPTPNDFLASPARFLVVHLDLGAEELRVRELDPSRGGAFPLGHPIWRDLRAQGPALARHLEELWGEPDYADARIRAWDLDAARRARAGGRA